VRVTLKELAALVGGRVLGDSSLEVSGISSLELAGPGDITFIVHAKYEERLSASRAAAVIVPREELGAERPKIVVEQPYLAYARVAAFFHPLTPSRCGVAPEAFVHPEATLGPGVNVYPLVWIDRRADIGQGVTLFPGVCVGEECVIGEQSVLYPGVVVYPRCRLGKRVIVHAGTVVGSDGFGYAREGVRSVKIPQLGYVRIDDDVEIGANTAIDRASFGATWIQRGVKIDNLVQLGHNVQIGEDAVLAGQVGLAGSVRVGRQAMLAGQVGIANHVQLGDGVMVGSKSGVAQDVSSSEVVSGIPAIAHRKWLRSSQAFPRLPELIRRLRAIEKRVESMEKKDHERDPR
jgi:UDP-3-O-[3-hydroxymyristoyl] glucosamine N-acyltransferase